MIKQWSEVGERIQGGNPGYRRTEGMGAPSERGQGCNFNAGQGECVDISQARK